MSLPPSILLGKEFVTIEKPAINQGINYDIYLGEYFTGEKIAIKTFRQWVDQETVKQTQEVGYCCTHKNRNGELYFAEICAANFELVFVTTRLYPALIWDRLCVFAGA